MKLSGKSIDKLVESILNEEINNKVSLVVEKLKGKQHKLDVAAPKGKITKADFDKLRGAKKKEAKEGKGMCEQCGSEMSEGVCNECGSVGVFEGDDIEVGEGNKFSGELEKARKENKKEFTVDGKTYPVKEGKEKWIQKTGMKKGVLHKKLGVPEDETIPVSKLKSLKKELQGKSKGDKKLSASDLKLLKQVNMALNLKSLKESSVLNLTETELVDMIENIVLEQKTKKEEDIKVSKVTNKLKDTISKKYVPGLAKTQKSLDASKKENDDYIASVTKKMKEYLKNGSEETYESNPEKFPQGNGQMKKGDVKAYSPSDAVEEYIEAFSYPGMTNLVYDEIKPEEEKIEMYLKGNSKTGNAEVDESGKALGNVVPSKTGERFMKNYKDNLYGAEQMGASYKRYPQDTIEVAGEKRKDGKLKNTSKAQKVLNKVEESEEKKEKIISEEMNKMKNLISYNKKTQ
jgi:hypothetical protein